jgi:hypothetical protein
MEENIFKNGEMILRLIKKSDEHAAFEHLVDGKIQEYVVGNFCKFDGNTVTWRWGTYNISKSLAIKLCTK